MMKYWLDKIKIPKVKEKELIGGYRRIVKKLAIKEKDIQIAKNMKDKKEPVEKIIEYTGLTKDEVEKL